MKAIIVYDYDENRFTNNKVFRYENGTEIGLRAGA